MPAAYTTFQSSTSRAAYKRSNRVFWRCYQTVAKTLPSRSREGAINHALHVVPALRDQQCAHLPIYMTPVNVMIGLNSRGGAHGTFPNRPGGWRIRPKS